MIGIGCRVRLLINPQLTLAEPSRAIAYGLPSNMTNCPFRGGAAVSQFNMGKSVGLIPAFSHSRRKTARSLRGSAAMIAARQLRRSEKRIRSVPFLIGFVIRDRSGRHERREGSSGQTDSYFSATRSMNPRQTRWEEYPFHSAAGRFRGGRSPCDDGRLDDQGPNDHWAWIRVRIIRRRIDASDADDRRFGLFDDFDQRVFKNHRRILRRQRPPHTATITTINAQHGPIAVIAVGSSRPELK